MNLVRVMTFLGSLSWESFGVVRFSMLQNIFAFRETALSSDQELTGRIANVTANSVR